MKNKPILVLWKAQLWPAWVVLQWMIIASGAMGQVLTYPNTNAIIFPPGTPVPTPYPSVIYVSNVSAAIGSVSVSLRNVSHAVPDHFDILLVGPNDRTVLLMSDAGGANPINSANLTFSATASSSLPDSSQILSGTYLPSNYESALDTFPAPAPAGPYGATLTAFNGSNPNGQWRLFVYDDTTGVVGSISNGWNITFDLSSQLTIVEQPQSQEANAEEDVTFQVTAFGAPPIQYQWYFNGAPMPGETKSSLKLSNVQPTSGGRFDVRVFNDTEAVASDFAFLTVQVRTALVATDDFRSRPSSNARSGYAQGDSRFATSEPGEPVPFGGGKSVWLEWVAPTSGVATFTTQGSAFDTWLSVFTAHGTTAPTVSNLNFVTQDDDRGGFYTSMLQFNATPGTSYQIALDGFGLSGSGGQYTLQWDLEPTPDRVPVIISNPQSQFVVSGESATFRVLAESSPPVTYQWFLNGSLIPGATANVFQLANPGFDDLGIYSVRLRSDSGRTTFSAGATLETGSQGFDLTFTDRQKYEISGRPVAGTFKDIGFNAPVSKLALAPGANLPCSGFKGVSEGLHALSTGTILVETTGSAVVTRLAVYTNYHELFQTPIACGGPGNPSTAKFNAVAGMDYTVEVIGYPTPGNIKLTNTLGIAPPILNVPKHCLVASNASYLLSMPATSWVPTPWCQWYFNDQPILGSNQTTLVVSNFEFGKQGLYSVVMSNFVRMATNQMAYLQLAGPFLLHYSKATNQNAAVGLRIAASNATPFVLEGAAELASSWLPLATNTDPCRMLILTNVGPPQQFFRAVPPQP